MVSTEKNEKAAHDSSPKIVEDKGDDLPGIDKPAGAMEDVNLAIDEPAPQNSTDEEKVQKKDNFQAKMWEHIDGVTGDSVKAAKENKKVINNSLLVVLLGLYLAYLVWACVYNFQTASLLLGLTIFCFLVFIYVKIRDNFGETIWENFGKPTTEALEKIWNLGRWVFVAIIVLLLAVGLYFLSRENPARLVSAFGLFVFIFLTYVFSKHPRHVKWRPVYWGLALQLIFGLLILRTEAGFIAFNWLGDLVSTILAYSDEGAKFVFGEETYTAHFFAFKVLPVVIYFSSAIALFYHLGIMQVVIKKIAWLMQNTMKTSATESLNAAGNIFVGQTEAPLMIRPLMEDMTKSELHAVMTGGFATIAGSVLGAYISFGVSASHLLSASVMSAPAALAIAKLFYPETKKSSTKTVDQIKFPKSEHRNAIEAASYGAYTAIPLVLNIAGNLIAFLALLALFNGILGYLGSLVGHPEVSFTFICGYLFWPIAWVMGVESKDCLMVAQLLGAKTFINEFYAYDQLGILIKNRLTGVEPYLTIRSEVITTYALCGFANFGSVGIQLGALTSMVPNRKSDLADVAVRALIAGSIACFMTACIAGLLYDEANYDAGAILMLNSATGAVSDAVAMTTAGTTSATVNAIATNATTMTAAGSVTAFADMLTSMSTKIVGEVTTAMFNVTPT